MKNYRKSKILYIKFSLQFQMLILSFNKLLLDINSNIHRNFLLTQGLALIAEHGIPKCNEREREREGEKISIILHYNFVIFPFYIVQFSFLCNSDASSAKIPFYIINQIFTFVEFPFYIIQLSSFLKFPFCIVQL